MPDLSFQVRGAEPVRDALTPMVALGVEIINRAVHEPIHSIALRCQIQVEAPRRRYLAEEQDRLRDLFGEPERWGQTLRPLLWTNLSTTVPAFSGSTTVSLLIPCTFDLNVTASKYFHGVEGGTVPITAMFSGTVFYQAPENHLQAAPISWNSESRFAFPIDVWKQCIHLHSPHTAWLGLRRDVFERLYEYKVQHGLATFDEALVQMLQAAVPVM